MPTVDDPPEIEREYILRMLGQMLEGPIDVVVVEGEEGIGKTTLLRQFVRHRRDRTLAIFITAASRWAYDPSQMAYDLCSQIHHCLTGNDIQEDQSIDDALLQRLINELRRRARRTGTRYFFVLDGLADIPLADDAARRRILDLLPFGVEEFRFILSGDSATLPLVPSVRRTTKPYQLGFFLRDEADRFLEPLPLTREQKNEIYELTGGVPIKLASVRRILASEPRSDIGNLPTAIGGLFEREWQSVNQADEATLLLLAILAFEHRGFTMGDLAAVARLDPLTAERSIRGLKFLDRSSDGVIRFSSDVYRRLAGEALVHYRQRVNELFIDHYLERPDTDESLDKLSSYFASAGKLAELVQYLSPERFATLYRRAPSLSAVQRQADQGIAAAIKLGREDEVVRFSLQRSAVEELARSDIAVSEVRARAGIGDYDAALALAEASQHREVQFRLLAALARARREAGLADDPILTSRLRTLFAEVEPDELRETASDIASDLLYTHADMAIELVSRHASVADSGATVDWGIARLIVQSHVSDLDPNVRSRTRDLATRISDPVAKRLSTDAVFIFGGLSAAEVVEAAKKLETASHRLYVLRHWMRGNRDRPDASLALDYAMTVLLQATDAPVDASVYRDLSLCLPHLRDVQRISYYIGLIDANKATLAHLGPSEAYVRLQILLARAEWRHDRTASQSRFEETYTYISSIKDSVVKAAAVARLVSALSRLDPTGTLTDADFVSIAEQELHDTTDRLLNETANHDEAVRGVLDALSVGSVDRALALIPKINTEPRRDEALRRLVESTATASVDELDCIGIEKAVSQIHDESVRDRAVSFFVRSLDKRSISSTDLSRCEAILRRVNKITDLPLRVVTASRLVRMVGQQTDPTLDGLKEMARSIVVDVWRSLDDTWVKLDVGLIAVAEIARADRELAASLVADVNALKGRLPFQDRESALASELGLRLAIRAFGGLLAKRLDSSDDLDRLLAAIGSCGSVGEQVGLLAELATHCAIAQRHEECQHVVQRHLLPMIQAVPQEREAERSELIVRSAVAIYLGAPATMSFLQRELTDRARDEALELIGWFILTKTAASDPYDSGPRSGFDINFEDSNRLVELMHVMTDDSQIYAFISRIADSLGGTSYRANLSRLQKSNVATQLEKLAVSKFPNPRFIRHEGYLICSRAQINRFVESSDEYPWESLASATRRIPNTADKAFVMTVIASACRIVRLRQQYLEEAREIIDSIGMITDRVDRYIGLAQEIASSEPTLAKGLLRHAYELCEGQEGETIDERRQKLIDLAFRVDSALADSLAAATDDDPAKAAATRQIELYKLRDAILERDRSADLARTSTAVQASKVAWLRLSALNAKLIPAVATDRTLALLEQGARQPISAGYPVFAWFIANAIRRSNNTGTVREYVLPLFEALLRGAELALRAAARTSLQTARLLALGSSKLPETKSLTVRDGDRDLGLAQLRRWLQEKLRARLYIMEPYFDPPSVELLTLVREATDDCEVLVCASRKDSLKGINGDHEAAYREAWTRVAVGEPPATRIILGGAKTSGKFPVHDRWWLTEGSGLHLGTSYNGIGSRISNVRELSTLEARNILAELAPYFGETRFEFDGERMMFSSFTL